MSRIIKLLQNVRANNNTCAVYDNKKSRIYVGTCKNPFKLSQEYAAMGYEVQVVKKASDATLNAVMTGEGVMDEWRTPTGHYLYGHVFIIHTSLSKARHFPFTPEEDALRAAYV